MISVLYPRTSPSLEEPRDPSVRLNLISGAYPASVHSFRPDRLNCEDRILTEAAGKIQGDSNHLLAHIDGNKLDSVPFAGSRARGKLPLKLVYLAPNQDRWVAVLQNTGISLTSASTYTSDKIVDLGDRTVSTGPFCPAQPHVRFGVQTEE